MYDFEILQEGHNLRTTNWDFLVSYANKKQSMPRAKVQIK